MPDTCQIAGCDAEGVWWWGPCGGRYGWMCSAHKAQCNDENLPDPEWETAPKPKKSEPAAKPVITLEATTDGKAGDGEG